MTTTIPACVRGCTILNLDGSRDPAPASHGHLCSRCTIRLREALDIAPDAIALLRARVGRQPAPQHLGDRITGTKDAPEPIRRGHMHQADALHALLWGWCAETVRILGERGPRFAHDLLAADRDAGHIPVDITAGATYMLAREASWWMIGRLHRIVHLTIVDDMTTELSQATSRAAAAAGLTGPRVYVARRVCPICDTRTVKVRWLVDGSADVRCTYCHEGVTVDAIDIDRLIPRTEAAA